jgi:putative ABC transport system substrate-binding protein
MTTSIARRELGWVEGRNLAIEYRWAEGRTERLNELASDLVRLKVDVIVTHNTPAPLAAKQATSTIPIVFATAGDPVGAGIVAGLARPGGNVTGLSSQTPDVAGKRLELMREIIPGLRRLAVLADTDNPFVKLDVSQLQQAGAGLGIDIATFQMQRGEDIDPAFQALKSRSQALYVPPTPVAFVNRIRINTLALAARVPAPALGIEVHPIGVRDPVEIEHGISAFAGSSNAGLIVLAGPLSIVHRELIITLAARHRLPTVYGLRFFVTGGGLISYGPDTIEPYRRAAGYVDRILKGEKPGDLPVQAPTKYELVINLKTAKALELEVPATLLARADEVIE